jgi:NADPH:quinone reductase-like Zn-dependent oxidoreductase
MIALQFPSFGEPANVVAPKETAKPEPGPGEVRLKLVLSPIHNHDLATVRGIYGVKPPLPAIGGSELLGVVDALGEGVANLAPGQRVSSGVRGSWSEYVIANAAGAVPIPDTVSDEVGAQLLAMPLSAMVLFEELHAPAGSWIVQNAANGAVGRNVMRIAQAAGVNVVNLVRREASVGEMQSFGAKHVVNTEVGDWINEVRDIVGNGNVVAVVDSVCDKNSMALNGLLGRGGQHVVFGALGTHALAVNPSNLIFKESTIRGFWMIAWMERATQEQRVGAIVKVVGLAMNGTLALPAGGIYPLSKAWEALKAAETPGRSGKILFAP